MKTMERLEVYRGLCVGVLFYVKVFFQEILGYRDCHRKENFLAVCVKTLPKANFRWSMLVNSTLKNS